MGFIELWLPKSPTACARAGRTAPRPFLSISPRLSIIASSTGCCLCFVFPSEARLILRYYSSQRLHRYLSLSKRPTDLVVTHPINDVLSSSQMASATGSGVRLSLSRYGFRCLRLQRSITKQVISVTRRPQTQMKDGSESPCRRFLAQWI